ncbi:FadR/GntR family transcriptional regulator [Oceaniglobus trochenteri]|uniref:FadR/GntR family transcriptional regulator n=1 Tax=Oceaniglobus trochenteri TaxID=2763260 RepID=UPI001CFFE4FA|nr:FadR/GntR family transcriptional regulator [Oceaniglobus trochenteri]
MTPHSRNFAEDPDQDDNDGPEELRESPLADQVYERILERIIDGDCPPGTRLPAEQAFSAELGVSRPVLRQALRQLRADGLIQSRRGSGSYVQKRPDREMLRFAPVGSITDLGRTFEFRATVESEAAALAAERWQPEGMARIEAALATMDRTVAEGKMAAKDDEELHLAICAAAGNHYFLDARRSLHDQILTGMNVALSLSHAKPRARLALVQGEHRKVVEAIRRRDGDAARDSMRTHIENARQRVFGG